MTRPAGTGRRGPPDTCSGAGPATESDRVVTLGWSPWRTVVGFGVVSLAADMVYEGSRSITEIAYQLGFSDPANFTRAFRRWMGVAPRGLKKKR